MRPAYPDLPPCAALMFYYTKRKCCPAGRVPNPFLNADTMTNVLTMPHHAVSDDRYEELLNSIGEGFLVLDHEFRILEINAEGLRLDGRSKAELIGRTHWEVWPESLGTPIESGYRKAMAENAAGSFTHHLVSDRYDYWLEVRVFPVRNGLAAFFRDVSASQMALSALQRSEDRFKAAVAATGVMWTNDAAGRMTGPQPGWSALTGQTQAEYEGYGWADAVHPDDAQATVDAWNKTVANGAIFDFEHRIRRADGQWRTFAIRAVPVKAADGQVREWVGVHTDITQRKQFEDAMLVKDARLRLATEVAGLGIWTWDPESDTVTWENTRIYRIFGLPDDAQPVSFGALAERYLAPQDRAAFEAATGHTVASGARLHFQGRITPADDSAVRWVELAGEICTLESGAPGVLGTISDITERRANEAALRLTADELAAADRNKTEFIVTLAHELRNPLAPIRNGLQVLRMASGKPETVARVCGVMDRQVGQMVHLIDDLLDMARISRGQLSLNRQPVDLNEIAATAIETSLPLIEKGMHVLTVDIPTEPVMLSADPNRIAQVISNLLNNAAKYSTASGSIHLEIRREDATAVVTVTDTGIGIPPEALPRIFALYSQVKEHVGHAQGGLGIGLALVRTLVELHGGTVAASSAGRDRGSCFIVRLPIGVDA